MLIIFYKFIISILSLYTIPATPCPNTISFISFSDTYFFVSQPLVFIKCTSLPKLSAILLSCVLTSLNVPGAVYTFSLLESVFLNITCVFELNKPDDFSIVYNV